ncbi:meprin A subunit beta-like [Anguilla anguilla]|uniref:meprin A subunit beta-like n=1 Tax=Anguilla anguilla TaxID=7936 RepID=UPI0015AD60C9|nr:meprin A subunit beta-like [Anguilla anguilla]
MSELPDSTWRTMAAYCSFLILSLIFHQTLCLPTARLSDFDVDGGKDRDIFDINEDAGLNLVEGDIVYDEKQGRNSILGDQYRWPTTIPYYLEDSLEINAKGVILKAFEQYRLKSCIDFKPWEGEPNYISVFKGSGCFSYVGNRRVGRQQLSIGTNCDRIATIEHEFLHALGFWHEQSRADRDDYVNIMWDRISEGREHNFNTYDDTTSSALNVPYDYGSMMHYSKDAFRNGTEPTIVTKIPAFMDVIGQRMEFSDNDLLKLNKLYNCTTSSTFLETCSFELENVCGMIQGPGDTADWTRLTQAPGGPLTDYTNMGRCKDAGYFMHFSTATGTAGDRALLESRFLYPKRGFQCLQFFLHHSGNAEDELNIWVREYDKANPDGTLRFIQRVTAAPQDLWEVYHVSMKVSKKFRVVFEGKKGVGLSTGGLSIDDINLSETECPDHVWRIKNFNQVRETTPVGAKIFSPRFLSKEGYTFQVSLYINGLPQSPENMGIYLHLTSGLSDNTLKWPCPWKQATMMLLDQNPDIRQRMSNQRSVTTDPTQTDVDGDGNQMFFWDDPRKVGALVTDPDGMLYYIGPGYGTSLYLTHSRADSRDFIKGGDAIFLLTMEDVSKLLETQPLPPTTKPTNPAPVTNSTHAPTTDSAPPTSPPDDPCNDVTCENDGVCVLDQGVAVCRCAVGDDWWYTGERCQRKGSSQDAVTTAVAASVSVLAAMLVVTVVSVVCVKKKYKKKLRDSSAGMTLENKTTF